MNKPQLTCVTLTGLMCLATFAVANQCAVAMQTKIKIASPRGNAEVASVEVVTGMIGEQGQPFLLVRPKVTGQKDQKNPWWIQKNVQVDLEGRFMGQVHFGNKQTKDGTVFEVLAILVRDADLLKTLQSNYSIDELPRTVPRSRIIQVKLKSEKKVTAPVGFVTYPQQDHLVGRHETLNGIIPKYGTPVVLVRAEEGNGLWWVQNVTTADARGRFNSKLHFGNDKTPDKSKFQIAVVVLEEEAAASLKQGSTLKKLPRDHLGLQTISVELHHEITQRHVKQ